MQRALLFVSGIILATAACGDGLWQTNPRNGAPAATTPAATTPTSTTGDVEPDDTCALADVATLTFPATTVGASSVATIRVTNCSTTGSITLDTVETSGEAFGTVLTGSSTAAPGEELTFDVTFAPTAEGLQAGGVSIVLAEGIEPLEVALDGTAIRDIGCVDTVAGARHSPEEPWWTSNTTRTDVEIQLDGSSSTSPNGDVARYDWKIVAKPLDSRATLSSNSDAAPSFTPDLIGSYRIELVATDDEGAVSCSPAQIELVAGLHDDVVVELVWTTPGDEDRTDENGADLDLHWKHPFGEWNQGHYDIFWDHRSADWGPPGPSGDPILYEGDDNAGPETLGHSDLETGLTYALGVHYFNPNGLGTSYATVRIFVRGKFTFEMRNFPLENANDFVHVADLSWPSGSVTTVDRKTTGFP